MTCLLPTADILAYIYMPFDSNESCEVLQYSELNWWDNTVLQTVRKTLKVSKSTPQLDEIPFAIFAILFILGFDLWTIQYSLIHPGDPPTPLQSLQSFEETNRSEKACKQAARMKKKIGSMKMNERLDGISSNRNTFISLPTFVV
jgi:hypothetical protein